MPRHFGLIPRKVRREPIRTPPLYDPILNVVAVTLSIAVIVGLIACSVFLRKAHGADFIDHEHGITVPDWYDTDCCNLQDCRPIDTKDVEFDVNGLGNPVVIYRPFSIEFTKDRWRNSKDERYHACFRGNQDAGWTAYCIYLPALG